MQDIIDVKNFLRSTRESGYRNLTLALAELIDNSIQAGATFVRLSLPVKGECREDWEISVLDDGCGMGAEMLAKSLAFGGSNRYDDRRGLGRFGMGLPNSSLSQARRVEVYSWIRRNKILGVALDLDRVLRMEVPTLETLEGAPPGHGTRQRTPTGTLVRWLNIDRPEPRSWEGECRTLSHYLGRIFRNAIAEGLNLTVNDQRLESHDPLMCDADLGEPLGRPYGDVLLVQAGHLCQGGEGDSIISIRFSELDVRRLSRLGPGEKRALGIVGGAGVSVVRAGREIDYRWTFLSKRKENYDEWWRCEVAFEPDLDEAFGVANTKQGIRPSEQLRALLTPQITSVARTLNARARTIHAEVATQRSTPHEEAAAIVRRQVMQGAADALSSLDSTAFNAVVSRRLSSTEAFEMAEGPSGRQLVVNENHPFYQVFYGPLRLGALTPDESLRGLDVLLLSLAYREHEQDASLSGLLRLFFAGMR